jgi:hypothetical protein
MSTPPLQDYLFKGAMALAGASLAINSFLVKDKVGEMTASLRAVESAVKSLELSGAIAQQQQLAMAKHIDRNTEQNERQDERLRAVEDAMAQLRVRINR